jgi:hypothetical protein
MSTQRNCNWSNIDSFPSNNPLYESVRVLSWTYNPSNPGVLISDIHKVKTWLITYIFVHRPEWNVVQKVKGSFAKVSNWASAYVEGCEEDMRISGVELNSNPDGSNKDTLNTYEGIYFRTVATAKRKRRY